MAQRDFRHLTEADKESVGEFTQYGHMPLGTELMRPTVWIFSLWLSFRVLVLVKHLRGKQNNESLELLKIRLANDYKTVDLPEFIEKEYV